MQPRSFPVTFHDFWLYHDTEVPRILPFRNEQQCLHTTQQPEIKATKRQSTAKSKASATRTRKRKTAAK